MTKTRVLTEAEQKNPRLVIEPCWEAARLDGGAGGGIRLMRLGILKKA